LGRKNKKREDDTFYFLFAVFVLGIFNEDLQMARFLGEI